MPIKDPDARRKYQREWMARRRAEFFQDKLCVEGVSAFAEYVADEIYNAIT